MVNLQVESVVVVLPDVVHRARGEGPDGFSGLSADVHPVVELVLPIYRVVPVAVLRAQMAEDRVYGLQAAHGDAVHGVALRQGLAAVVRLPHHSTYRWNGLLRRRLRDRLLRLDLRLKPLFWHLIQVQVVGRLLRRPRLLIEKVLGRLNLYGWVYQFILLGRAKYLDAEVPQFPQNRALPRQTFSQVRQRRPEVCVRGQERL